MIFGTPVTWFLVEVLSVTLFITCIVHAARQEHGLSRVLELLAFLLYASAFENIGVYTKLYDYNLHRILMVGKVPLEIPLIEAVIFYAAMRLSEYLHIPRWGMLFVVGFLSSFQDMTLDPSAIYDRHVLDGIVSGRWNWADFYTGTFFGIPFFNFSGWLYLMAYYVITTQVGMWLYKKYKKEWLGVAYPFLAALAALLLLVSPITRFTLFGEPFFPRFTRLAELVLMVVNYAVGIFILLRYMKVDRPFDFKKDAAVYVVPLALHVYDLIIAFALGLQQAYFPVAIVSILHLAFFAFIFGRSRKLAVAKKQVQVMAA